jgi:hypothetical protein
MEFCVSPHNNLCQQRAERVNQYIAEACFPQRHKGLVPFIQTGVTYGNQECNDCPIQSPTVAFRPNAMKNSDTEDTEFGDVCSLSNSEMHQSQHMTAGGREKPPQCGKDETPGLLGTEVVGRKERNHNGNTDCRQPVFETRNHLKVFHFEVALEWDPVVANLAICGIDRNASKSIACRTCLPLQRTSQDIVG